MKHVAKIIIQGKVLLKILDFEDGHIWDIQPHNKFGDISIVIEHSDLPEIQESMPLEIIAPIYTSTYGDNGCLFRIERVEPKKVV